MGDGVLDIDFQNKLREKKGEKNKEYKALIPEVFVKQSLAPKRKASFTTNTHEQKQMRFDNYRTTVAMGRTGLNILLLVMVTATSQQGLIVRDLVISRKRGKFLSSISKNPIK